MKKALKKILNTKEYCLLALLLILQLVLLIVFGSEKKGMHFDEYYSYFTTNYSGGRAVADRSWLTAEDVKKDFYVCPEERFHYGTVVQMQSYDVHPPVFYLLLHTVCSLMPGVYSVWQGLGLNIFYALITTVFVYAIAKRLTGEGTAAFVITLLYVCNPGVITNVMLIRMYMLMTLWITIAVWLHLRMGERWHWSYFVWNAALAYVGFLTHYFYLIFLFFLEAGYWLPRLKREWKRFLVYGGFMLGAGILAVVSYPASLGHIFAGYRGKQAASNMMNLADFGARFEFFTTLLNSYVFQGALLSVGLLALAAFIALTMKRRGRISAFVQCVIVPTVGFYLVSVKASLYGEVAMLRYQLPVYGLIFLAICVILTLFVQEFLEKEGTKRYGQGILAMMAVVLLCMDIWGLVHRQVYFCYPEQETMVAFAREHTQDTVVYLYHQDEYKYLIWGDAEQLWNYEKVYFVSTQNMEALKEEEIRNAERLVVYVSIMAEQEDFSPYAEFIYRSAPGLTSYRQEYQGVYATAYMFE